jgi:hypothetical protein
MALSRLRRFSVTYLTRQIYNLAFTENKLKTIPIAIGMAMCKLEIAVHFTAILAI